MQIQAKVFESIGGIDPVTWDSLLHGRSISFSHAFWDIIEKAGLNDFRYRHVVFQDMEGLPLGLCSFYVVTTDIAIFAPAWLRRLLIKVRRVFPGFLKLRMLECGTPIILNSPPIVSHPDIGPEELMPCLHDTLKNHARKEGVLLIVMRDFESPDQHLFETLREFGYHKAPGLPNTYLDIRWKDIADYRASLKSYYRSKINNHLRKNAELGVHHDMVDDFAELADELCRQWMIVHERANEFQREVLTPVFYRQLSERLHPHAKVLRFFRQDKWIGHALLLHDGDVLRWLYFGRNEPVNDSLYLYVVQSVIEAAIGLGVKRIEMGLTTYSIKQDVGARLEPIDFAIRCPIDIFNPLVGRIYGLLNKPAQLHDKDVFKSDKGPSAS